MSVLLPDDLARDLGLLLNRGWFVAALQKVQLKTRWAYLVNTTKDPAWKLLLDYDPSFSAAFTSARLYRNEFEFTDLNRDGLLRSIVQPDVIDGPWETLPEEETSAKTAEAIRVSAKFINDLEQITDEGLQ